MSNTDLTSIHKNVGISLSSTWSRPHDEDHCSKVLTFFAILKVSLYEDPREEIWTGITHSLADIDLIGVAFIWKFYDMSVNGVADSVFLIGRDICVSLELESVVSWKRGRIWGYVARSAFIRLRWWQNGGKMIRPQRATRRSRGESTWPRMPEEPRVLEVFTVAT